MNGLVVRKKKEKESQGKEKKQQLVPLSLSHASWLARICSRCDGQVGPCMCRCMVKGGVANLSVLCGSSVVHVGQLFVVVVLLGVTCFTWGDFIGDAPFYRAATHALSDLSITPRANPGQPRCMGQGKRYQGLFYTSLFHIKNPFVS